MTGRSNTVKNLEEGHLYGLIANANEHKLGVVQFVKITGAVANTASNGDENTGYPDISGEVTGYIRTVTAIDGGEAETPLTVAVNGGTPVSIPAGTPSGRGFACTDYLSGAVEVTGGVDGYIVELVYVPTFTASTDEIDYVTDFGRTFPDEYRPIYDKGVFKHRKRIHNVERTLSFTSSFLSYEHIMHKFANLESTLCFERTDDAGAGVSEREYFGKVFFKEPDVSGSGGDTDSTSTTTARYERWMTMETT